jgi:RES domain-containing protein
MIVYRIARTEYCDTSGEGAKLYGGRWNLPGYPALYGCSTIASALLERLTVDPELFSSERYILYSIMEFNCPDRLIEKPDLNELPKNWDAIPFNKATQEFGTRLIQSGVVCFAIPSVVDKTSLNFVINPLSGDFKSVKSKIYPLELDKRIIR